MTLRTSVLVGLSVGLLGLGPFQRRAPAEPAGDPEGPPPPLARIPPDIVDLFSEPLPISTGGVPSGVASLSAQACGACHYQAHDTWRDGVHARASQSGAWAAAARDAADPTCTACHLPLQEQRAKIGDAPNPNWSASLTVEGVTCAACHVREGAVVGGRPGVSAPHPMRWSPQLSESGLCADCHQLTVAGSSEPLYDTFGEWERSPQGQAGLSCQDCHAGPGVSGLQHGSHHGPRTHEGRGLSILAQLATDELVRGGEPLTGTLVLQNTGAGHHIPTGSPFAGLRVEVAVVIETPEDEWRSALTAVDLVREVEPAPPYSTTADTRIPAGGEHAIPLAFSIAQEAPGGPAYLEVVLRKTVRGTPTDDIVQRQRIPLQMD